MHSRSRQGWDHRKQKTLRDRGKTGASCSACGKIEYTTRAAAKTAIRRLHRGEKFQTYRCGDHWHIGHQARDITNGTFARSDIYAPVTHARTDTE